VERRRALGLVAIPITVALGAASRMWPLGFALWDKSLGDVAYAMLLGFVLVVAWPRARPLVVFGLTAAGCFAIELFQLTGLPRRAPPLLRMALGDTFAWHDVACYLVGAAVVAFIRRVSEPSRTPDSSRTTGRHSSAR
jgi:hypothetical protein